MINYNVIEKKEILHELFAGLLADSARIIQENGIDIDSDTHICDTRRKVREIWGSIITDKYSTMEQMKELEDYYKSVKKQIEGCKKGVAVYDLFF